MIIHFVALYFKYKNWMVFMHGATATHVDCSKLKH